MALRQIYIFLAALLGAIPAAAAAPHDAAFVAWAKAHAAPLPACASIKAGADYRAIAASLGTARVVALGEPVHGAHEPLALRNCLFRYLVEEQGFTAIALETGLHESRRLHDYVAGGAGDVREVARSGFTWGFWRYPENIELLEWIRAYNLDPAHARKIAVYGIDVSGGDADGAWARARITLDEGLDYLARAAPASSMPPRKDIEPFLGRFSAPSYRALTGRERKKLRLSIAGILAFFDTNRAALVAASSQRDYDWARQNVVAAQQLQSLFDVSGVPDPEGRLLPGDYRADAARDAAMADNALWALDREGPRGRILLFAHNGHVMNGNSRGGIWSVYARPPSAMGAYLRRKLGRELLILGSSLSARSNGAGRPRTMDAALERVSPAQFLVDIRMATGKPAQWLSQEQSISVNYTTENLIVPQQAFDVLISFP
ncbi:erythromycin esterase family protein [Sphingopyxis sp.]|uniref:erythromycin esterase family protein n=1 Tax=Sphingopyxis sp. TaxID=1908224 RepID=UPI002D78CC05|nr:erythromycin esterase family protein [Sphingopyxis sp.]HET6523559.1 erythromycin esterase family protein [Sphingopyxis sp.]